MVEKFEICGQFERKVSKKEHCFRKNLHSVGPIEATSLYPWYGYEPCSLHE
jgi:hypothetical protein